MTPPLSIEGPTQHDLVITARLEQRMKGLGSFETPEMCASRKAVSNDDLGVEHMQMKPDLYVR